ncbi:Ankyrin repeat-containing domain protein [Elaphomyces granulatus]
MPTVHSFKGFVIAQIKTPWRVKEIEILKRLNKSPYRERKERNPERIEGTCEWFMAHKLFRDWHESKSSTILWVSADPGCGKSVLRSALCYILHQLFKQKRILLSEEILEQFEIKEDFTDENAGEIVCLLDAIDECEDHGRSQLTQALCKLYGTRSNFNLNRPYGEIRRGFQLLELPGLPVVHLSGESDVEMKKISQEINVFIKARTTHPNTVHGNLKWKHSLRPKDSNRVLAEICMRYLLFSEFEAKPLDNDAMLSQYAGSPAKHWTTHVLESDIEVDNAATQSMLRLCDTSSKRCLTWFKIYWTSTNTDFPKNFTDLMIASYFGLTAVVSHLLEIDSSDLNSKDRTYGWSALSWAAGRGFDVVVKLLIDNIGGLLNMWLPFLKGAQVDSVDRYGRTPLVYAVWNGHVAVVKRLLRAGACINLADEIGGTALSYAVCNRDNDVLKLLLKKGTEADSADDTSMALLWSAVKKDHKAVA